MSNTGELGNEAVLAAGDAGAAADAPTPDPLTDQTLSAGSDTSLSHILNILKTLRSAFKRSLCDDVFSQSEKATSDNWKQNN